MKLGFFNWYGNGDLFDSREFVLDWMRLAGVTSAHYAYQERYLGNFTDLPQLRWTPLTRDMNPHAATVQIGDTLFVNTWIGRGWNGKDNGYVLNPGTGCVVEQHFAMHNDMLAEAKLGQLPRSVVEYIPTIDYTRVEVKPVQAWLEKHAGKRLVLIANGPTTSLHSANHDFGAALDLIPARLDTIYILTEKAVLKPRKDVVYSDSITQRGQGDWDLSAISYLSRFCSVIVGRCSGPHMFGQVLPNWLDSTKALVCFTHHRNGACFVRYPEVLGLKMNVRWSPATEPSDVAAFLSR